MKKMDEKNTLSTIVDLASNEGGDLHFSNSINLSTITNWITASSIPSEYRPFLISIYDTELKKDIVSLVMMINPRDLNISQAQITSSSNTRTGWVNTLWGNQQAVITATGLSAGFYYVSENGSGGITNFYRKRSLGYLNLMAIISLFKNNGYYYMDGQENPTMFKDGTSRVINVMDVVHVSYDGSDYLGSFTTFSLTDAAANPYRMEYSFEFSVATFGSDPNTIDGHMKRGGNENSNKVIVGIQGKNTDFSETVIMNQENLEKYFHIDPTPEVVEFSYKSGELLDEQKFYGSKKEGYWDTEEGRASLVKVPKDTIRITRGWKDGEGHDGKVDYRTASGIVRSFTAGEIVSVGGPSPGGPNFVIVKSDFNGKTIYTRYYHLDPNSMTDLRKGTMVPVGSVLGREGTDGGKYPPHIDLAVSTEVSGKNIDFSTVVDASPVMEEGTRALSELAKANPYSPEYSDYKNVAFKHGDKTNPPPPLRRRN